MNVNQFSRLNGLNCSANALPIFDHSSSLRNFPKGYFMAKRYFLFCFNLLPFWKLKNCSRFYQRFRRNNIISGVTQDCFPKILGFHILQYKKILTKIPLRYERNAEVFRCRLNPQPSRGDNTILFCRISGKIFGIIRWGRGISKAAELIALGPLLDRLNRWKNCNLFVTVVPKIFLTKPNIS